MAKTTKLTIQVTDAVDVSIETVSIMPPNPNPTPGPVEVVVEDHSPAAEADVSTLKYAKAYRWNAAGCGASGTLNSLC